MAKGGKNLPYDNYAQMIKSISEVSGHKRNNERLIQSAGDKVQLEVSTSEQMQLTRGDEFAGMLKNANCFPILYLFI